MWYFYRRDADLRHNSDVLFPNLKFLYFATATGESFCGGLCLFGPHNPIFRHVFLPSLHDSRSIAEIWMCSFFIGVCLSSFHWCGRVAAWRFRDVFQLGVATEEDNGLVQFWGNLNKMCHPIPWWCGPRLGFVMGIGIPMVIGSRVVQVWVRCWILTHCGIPWPVPVVSWVHTGILSWGENICYWFFLTVFLTISWLHHTAMQPNMAVPGRTILPHPHHPSSSYK